MTTKRMLTNNPTTHAQEIEVDGQWFTSDEDLGWFGMHTPAFLAAIALGKLDVRQLAREVLACSGRDETGKWVGFDAAAAELDRPRTYTHYNADGRAVNVTIPEA